MAAKKAERIATRIVTRKVQCLLRDEDATSLTDRAAKLHSQMGHLNASLTEQLKEIRAKHRAEVKAATSKTRESLKSVTREREDILCQLLGGVTERDVECEERIDYVAGTVSVVRKDTRDIIERRPIGPDERQLPIAGAEQ